VALALGAVGKRHSGFGTLTGQGNGQGGREHGQKADQLPGYRSITDPAARRHIASIWNVDERDIPAAGRSAFELLDALGSAVRTLFIVGSNPVVSAPDASSIERRLRSLDTLVVSDFFLSETARLAHIVLPAAQWAEEDGTMTNLEGRVIRRRQFTPPPEGVRTDIDILCGIAEALGQGAGFRYDSEEAVFNELARATAGGIADYSGMSYRRLEDSDGVFWPCRSADDPGTPRLFADRFPTPNGRARFHATPHRDVVDGCDGEFPLRLTTGRVLAQYQSGTQTRRVEALCAIAPQPLAEMHPAAAARAGVGDGERLTLISRRGEATFVLKVTRAIREDTVFVPFHWGGAQSINRLTSRALDPVSRMPEFKVCAVRAEPAGVIRS
jgi:assimilatory nitrate reductase catalytic subunit